MFRALVAVGSESVDLGLERLEGFSVRLFLRGICASGEEGNRDRDAGIFRRLLDTRSTRENDQVGQRDLLTAGCRRVEFALDLLERLQHAGQLGWLIGLPILLWG